jgi:C1A family cysteine protease
LGLKLPEFSKNQETETFNSEIFLGNNLIPEEFDWRDYPGVLGNVKNQYPCGNCWIYSALSALEAQIKIKQNRTVSLSEQNVFDCSDPNQSCNRGHFMAFGNFF